MSMYLRREATRESRTIFRYGNGTLSIQAPLAHLHCLQAVEVVAAAGCSAGTCNCRSTCFMQECHSCNVNRMIRTTSNARTTWDPELLTDFASASPCTTVANQKKIAFALYQHFRDRCCCMRTPASPIGTRSPFWIIRQA